MCLGIPGKIVEWLDREPLFARALIEFDGVGLECNMACVPDAQEGDFVIVHAGVAICQVDRVEAERTIEQLQRLELSELPDSRDAQSLGENR